MPDRSVASEASALVLSGPRLADGRAVDVRVCADRIEAVGVPGSLRPSPGAGDHLDLTGHLLLPAPAEPHAHHDTALTAVPGEPPPDTPGELRRRITEAVLLQLAHGATAQRSHIRIGDVSGLHALQAALETRRGLRGLAELIPVAVPRLLTGRAGADGRALLQDAAKMGATVLGGCPDLDPDPAGFLETVLATAAEHGCAVDLHTEADDPARLARLAAAAAGLRPGVTLGPCAGLARLPAESAARAADQLAASGITVICLPQGQCGLLPRDGGRTVPPVRLLRSAGVRVAAGSGALRDLANPVGRGDPLEAAFLLASLGETTPAVAYDCVGTHARRAIGLPEVRIESGRPAELLAIRGETVAGALSQCYSRLVIHRGRIVSRTSAVREFCGSAARPARGLPRQPTG
ncbi:hydrolase [Streptomyces sodiiphilus]|uniref:Hydrolase n=1 Tax=Streptomyces sodiiphilus TaxID=226217 RepID=A0ABN2PAR0_9ACTN